MKYSMQERINMILIIGECYENCLLAERVYAQKYPDRRHPDRRALEKLLQTFKTTGNVKYPKNDISKTVTENEDNQFVVLGSVVENPNTSTRSIARQTDLSQSSVSRILKNHKYHPFHIEMHQNLYGTDFQRRLEFCLWALEKATEDDFFHYVLFTDESSFHNNGLVNRHNLHYYDTENRHLFHTTDHQNRWSINVYGGIIGDQVIGPYFFDGHLNGHKFLRFLKRDFWELLEDVPLNIREKMWLQLDGAPAHFSRTVRRYLNRKFPNKWIGRGGPAAWPPRSPEMTPMDFFLWGHVKNIVYNSPPTTMEDMKQRIKDAFQTITTTMLGNARRSFEKRIRLCIQEDGQHFEHLL